MTGQSAYSNTTEAVGIFHAAEDLQAAVDDLLSQGFDRMDLSILASEKAIEDKLHEAYVPARISKTASRCRPQPSCQPNPSAMPWAPSSAFWSMCRR
jgi:hypothetical protein